MIRNPILYKISWYLLKKLRNTYINYIYVDTLAREQVLQQKVEPDRDYTIYSPRFWSLPCSQFCTVQSLKTEQKYPVFSVHSQSMIDNNDLCKITGINYYGLVKQYKKNICIVDLDRFYDE